MLGRITSIFSKKPLSEFDENLSREFLIQQSRIAFIDDDEQNILLDELRSSGFAVDHDKSGDETKKYDSQIYDVAIIDYHGVGTRLGNGQGLDLMRHIKRTSPRTRLIAYTSRSLSAGESEFFTLSHVVLPKDLGIADSLSLIEDELKNSFSKEHLFEALLAKISISSPSARESARSALEKHLGKKDKIGFQKYLSSAAGVAGEKAVEIILSKIFP